MSTRQERIKHDLFMVYYEDLDVWLETAWFLIEKGDIFSVFVIEYGDVEFMIDDDIDGDSSSYFKANEGADLSNAQDSVDFVLDYSDVLSPDSISKYGLPNVNYAIAYYDGKILTPYDY